MYKKQMTFQRIVCMLALIASAVVFVYSLGLATDLYDALSQTMADPNHPEVEGAQILDDIQPFNHMLLRFAIFMILASALLFITNTQVRRRYYIANNISTRLYVTAAIVLSVWAHFQLEAFKAQYKLINFEQLADFSELWESLYIGPNDTFWFDIHYVVFGLVLLSAVLLEINFAWKHKLMSDEKELIGQAYPEYGEDVSIDRLRFIKNKASSRLLILAIVFDVLYFISLYRSDVRDYYYHFPIGVSIIANLVFLLTCFLASEGVKNYKPAYSFVAFILAVMQIGRIFWIPMDAHNTFLKVGKETIRVMDDTQFFWILVFLIGSAVCLVLGGIINLQKSKQLAAHEASIARA